MTKSELLEKLAASADITKKQADQVLVALVETAGKTIKKGESVKIPGLGILRLRKMKVLQDVVKMKFTIANEDAWDGYQPARTRLLDVIRADRIRDVVVLTGDVHSSWGMDVTDDPDEPAAYDPATGRGSLGVEIVTPGVTSRFPAPGFEAVILAQNPHIRFGEARRRGWVVLDLSPERAKASWYLLEDSTQPETTFEVAATFATRAGENHLVPDDEPA